MSVMPSANISKSTKLRAITLSFAALFGASIPGGSWGADAKASKFYEDALVRYEKKDLDGAIIQLKNALQIDNTMLPVQLLLGKALLQNGDVAAAQVALLEALRLGVNRAEIVVPLAQAYLAQGKHKLILEQQQFNLAGLPSATQVRLLLIRASANADLGEVRGALQAIDDARAMDSKTSDVWLAEVPIRIRMRQFREATVAAERALALAPELAEAWYQKGSILHAAGDLQGTLKAYDRAITLDAKHVEARVARAGVYIDLGRQTDAASDVAELTRIAPKEPRGAYLQALLAERENKPEVAHAALKGLVGLLDPVPMDFIRYRPQLLMLNGLAHFGLNEREKAKQYLEAFQRSQGNTPASKLLAQIYMGESSTDRAIEVLETYLKAQPADGQALTMLSAALMAKGRNARAVGLMQQALKTRDAPEFHTVLGLGLIRSGQTSDAVSELEAALKLDPRQTRAGKALAELYLRGGQAAKAAVVAENLVKQQPSNAEFFDLLGMAKGDARDVAGARAAFEQSVKLDSAYMSPKLNLARLEIGTRSYDAAATRLAAILKTNEKNAEAMFEMAKLSEIRGQLAETQRWLEKANDAAGPKEIRWGLALSDFHLRNANPSSALEAAKRVSAKAPDNLAVLMAYAKAQLANGDTIAAKSTLGSATRLADYNPPEQVQIALLQLGANNSGGAAYSLEKALSTQPDFLPAMALMAEVELRQGEPSKAEKRARDIVTKYPTRAVGYSLLGDVAMARGLAAAAIDGYRRAHQIEPSTDTLLRLFRALATQDGGRPALLLAEQWIKTSPRDARVYMALADGYARAGNFQAARSTYESLLKITPDSSDVLNNLANALLRLKDPAAVKVAERAMAKNPNNANAIDTLGWALFQSQSGQTDRAVQLLRDARLREPGNPAIHYHLAAVLAQTGRKSEAREELELAFKAGRTFEESADAQTLLRTLK